MRRWARLLAAGLWLLAPLSVAAGPADAVPLPPLAARVTDLTQTLSADDRQRLDILLAGIERDRGVQIAILLLPTTQPESIEAFGIRLAEAWKIGRKGRDDGLIVIVAKNDRKMRIEVGYGLEGAIPDAIAKRVVAEYMAPRFKQGDFAGGLVAAAEALERAVAAGNPAAGGGPDTGADTAAAAAGTAADTEADAVGGAYPEKMPWLFLVIVLAGLARLLFGLFGSLAASAAGAWLAWLVFGSVPMAAGAALLVFLMSFVNLLSGGRGGGWSSGGGFSSGDGGGFSGGGGSFGGGGASGDW